MNRTLPSVSLIVLLLIGCGPTAESPDAKSASLSVKTADQLPKQKLPPPKPPLDQRVYGEFKLAEWEARLKDVDPRGREGQVAVDGLIALVRDVDVPIIVRQQSAFKLGQIGRDAVHRKQNGPPEEKSATMFAELLARHAGSDNPDDAAVTLFSLKALRMLGPAAKPATGPMMALLKDVKKPILQRAGALEVLSHIGVADSRAVPAVIGMLNPRRDAGVSRRDMLLLRRTAADGIAVIGPNAYVAVPLLLRCAKDPDTELQRKSLVAIGVMGSRATPAGINQLVDTLRYGDAPEVRDAAVEGLFRVGVDAVPQLMAILDPDEEIDADDKARAALALGKMGPIAKDALGMLDSALDDEDPWVRINAAEALWRISGKTTSAASALVLELESPNRQVQMRAIRLFKDKDFGPRATSALPALKRLLTHKNGRVRRAATIALRAIQPPK